jgi:hypothetical protein
MTDVPNPLDAHERPPAEPTTEVRQIADETRQRLEKKYLAAGFSQDTVKSLVALAGPLIEAALMRLIGT